VGDHAEISRRIWFGKLAQPERSAAMKARNAAGAKLSGRVVVQTETNWQRENVDPAELHPPIFTGTKSSRQE